MGLLWLWITLCIIILAILIYTCVWRHRIKNIHNHHIDNLAKIIPKDLSIESIPIVTKDGYYLQLFNLRSVKSFNPNLDPVLLQHPLGASALSWMICEDLSPAFILARLGCDVYLANSRGSAYGIGHSVINVDSYDYWDFSFQELGLDCQANLQYIREETGKKVHYLGLSQGGTIMVAALAESNRDLANEISNNIAIFHGLAPVVLIKETRVSSMKLSFLGMFFLNIFRKCGLYSVPPVTEITDYSKIKFKVKRTCWKEKTWFKSSDETNKKNYLEATDIIEKTHPQGASLKSLQHFAQLYNSKETKNYFKKYDHGEVENMRRYGSPNPPKYDLGAIKGKVILYYGTGDLFITKKSVEDLRLAMSGADVSVEWLEEWGHLSFIFGTEMKEFYTSIFEKHIKK